MVAGHPIRLLRERDLQQSSRIAPHRMLPPPYHLRNSSMFYLLCVLDPSAAAAALPEGLEACEPCMGVLSLITVRSGWGIAPYSGFYCTIQVKGHDGPDGQPANFIFAGCSSGVAGEVLHELYNDAMQDGWCRMSEDESGLYEAEAGFGADRIVRLTARRTERLGPEVAGINNYIGRKGAHFTLYTVAYNAAFRDLEEVRIEISDRAPPLLKAFQPVEIAWPLRVDDMALTFGPPVTLGSTPEGAERDILRATLFEVLSRLGRPAALIAKSGRIVFLTAEAEALLGLEAPALAHWRMSGVRGSVLGVVGRSLGGREPLVREPFILEHPDGRPVLAQMLRVHDAIASEPAALVLFSDPMRPAGGQSAALLQLLGLTPAEARLAVHIGQGRPPREAAEALDITVSTARSKLKTIYGKLAIARQSQLANLVARLDSA